MMGKIIFSIFALLIINSFEGECAKVVKSGIEQLSLNADRESSLWTAIGNNGTQGIHTDRYHKNCENFNVTLRRTCQSSAYLPKCQVEFTRIWMRTVEYFETKFITTTMMSKHDGLEELTGHSLDNLTVGV